MPHVADSTGPEGPHSCPAHLVLQGLQGEGIALLKYTAPLLQVGLQKPGPG